MNVKEITIRKQKPYKINYPVVKITQRAQIQN